MKNNLITNEAEIKSNLKKICKVTKNGFVLWNEPAVKNLLEKLGLRTVRIGNKIKCIQPHQLSFGEVTIEHLKYWFLNLMNNPDLQPIRRQLLKGGTFFSSEILNTLEQEFPDKEYEYYSEYYDESGVLQVTTDKMYYIANE